MPLIQLVYFLVNALQDRIGVIAFLQQHDAFHRVGIVDDGAVGAVRGAADLAEANLGSLHDGGDVLDADRRAVLRLDHGVLDVLHGAVEAERLHVDLLRALFDKAAAAVGVVSWRSAARPGSIDKPVGNQFLRIEADLVLLGRPAEAGNIHNARNALEGLLQRPVFERLLLHHVVGGIGALERVPVDLADRAPVRAHLRRQIGGKIHLAQPLEHVLAIHVAGGVVVEDEHQARKAGQRGGAQMRRGGECRPSGSRPAP